MRSIATQLLLPQGIVLRPEVHHWFWPVSAQYQIISWKATNFMNIKIIILLLPYLSGQIWTSWMSLYNFYKSPYPHPCSFKIYLQVILVMMKKHISRFSLDEVNFNIALCVCVCVCVWERERGRQRERMLQNLYFCKIFVNNKNV